MFKKNLISSIFFCALACNASAYTIYDAIVDAHENNNAIKSKLKELESSKTFTAIAYAGFLPSVSLSGQSTKSKNVGGGPFLDGVESRQTNRTIQVTQPLFSGGSSLIDVKSANLRSVAAYNDFLSNSYQLSFDVVDAYEKYLLSLKRKKLTEDNVKLARKNLEFAEIKFKYGENTKTDVYTTKAQLARFETEMENVAAQVGSYRSKLEYLIGKPLDFELTPIFIDSAILPKSLDDFMDLSLTKNPNIKVAVANVGIQNYQVKSVASGLLPNVSAYAAYSRSNLKNISQGPFLTQTPNSNQFGIQVSMPLFAPQTYPNISKARYDAQSAKDKKNDTIERVRDSVRSTWSSYTASKIAIDSAKIAVDQFTLALEATEEEAKLGTKTILDLLEAQQRLFVQQISLWEAELQNTLLAYQIMQLAALFQTIDVKEIKIKELDE